MYKSIGVFLFLLFTITSWSGSSQNQTRATQSISQNRTVASFNQIRVSGGLNVVLHTNAKNPRVVLRGDAQDLAHLTTMVKQNQLTIAFSRYSPKYQNITAHIYTRQLNVFHYQGAGVVSGKINSDALSLWINNPGTTRLEGTIRLRQLSVSGKSLVQIKGIKTNEMALTLQDNPKVYLEGIILLGSLHMSNSGFLSMYWVKSERLNIHLEEHAQLQLAGIVNVLNLKARGRSHFLGRYLRVRRAFVKTYDHALAEINVIHREHTLASGASDIHIYHVPEMREDFMAYNGAVLDMRQWNLPTFQNETVYNKP